MRAVFIVMILLIFLPVSEGTATLWSIKIDYGGSENLEGIFADSDGIYLAVSTETPGIIISRISPEGTFSWNRSISSYYGCEVKDITGNENAVFITGWNSSTQVDTEILIAKLSKNGSFIFKKGYSISTQDYGYGIGVGPDGYIYIVGSTAISGNSHIFLGKFDTNGNIMWNITWGNVGEGYGITFGTNTIYITGYQMSGVDNMDLVVAAFDLSGNYLWNWTLTGTTSDVGYDITFFNDSVFVAGSRTTSPAPISIRLSSSGTLLWQHIPSEKGEYFGVGVVYSTVYFAGYFIESSINHGLIRAVDADGRELFVIEGSNDTECIDVVDLQANIVSGGNSIDTNDVFLASHGRDQDDDGLYDSQELALGTSPTSQDSDNDGLNDGAEYFDYGTSPTSNDTDSDGMSDGWEVKYSFNPLNSSDAKFDADEDGLTNLEEYQTGTNPINADTDGDGYNDGIEVEKGTDPLDPNSHPHPEAFGWVTSPLMIEIGVSVLIAIIVIFILIVMRKRK